MAVKKKKKIIIKNSTKILLVTLVSMILVFVLIWFYQYSIYADLLEKEAKLQSQIEEQIKIKAELERSKNYMDSDEFVENIARKQLDMIKPNERIIINESDIKE